MKRKDIVSLLLSLVFSIAVNCIIYYISFIKCFVFLDPRQVTDPESIDKEALLLYAVLIMSSLIIVFFFKFRKRKYSAIGASLPIILWLVFFVGTGSIYLNKLNYYDPFNKTKWIEIDEKPLKMVRQLNNDEKLIGLSINEVNLLLGKGDLNNSREKLTYRTENPYAYFVLIIKDSSIIHTYIYYD